MHARISALLHDIKSSHSLRRALYIYMTVTTVLFVLLLSLMVNQTLSRNNDQWQLEASASLQQMQTLNNTSIRDISDYMTQQMDSYDLRNLLYSANYPIYLNIRARSLYDQLADTSSLIRNVQIINFQTRTVIDHNGRYSFDLYGDQDILTLLDSLTPSYHTRIYYYPRTMNSNALQSYRVERKVISMIYYFNKAGALVVNLDYDAYTSMMLSPDTSSPTEYFLYNEQGDVFCATESSLFTQSGLEDPIYQGVMAQKEDTGSFQISEGGMRKIISYIRSTTFGATYVAVTTLDGVYPGSPLFWQIMGLAALFLLVAAGISTALSLLISQPIRILRRSVREQLTEDGFPEDGVDENDFLLSVYQSILSSNRELKENSRLYQMEREGQMLMNLMNPASPSLRPSAAAISELEVKFPHALYRIITLMPDRRRIQMETAAQDIRRRIATTAGETLRSLGVVRTVFPPSFKVVFLLNLEETEPALLHSTLVHILSECERTLNGMRLYMGVGDQVTSLDDIAESYLRADEAALHAYRLQETAPAFAEQLSFPDLNDQSYLFELDEKISRAIRHMEKDKAEEAICQFFDQVSSYYQNQFVRNTLHLDVVLQRLEISLQLDGSPSSHIDSSTVMHWNREDACQYFIHRAQVDISQLQDMKKSTSTSSELIVQIDQMIDANILNPDFSIVQLADTFSFSVNYLRSLYKASAGESLSAHITRKRVEVACQLLDNSDESIESITMKLGFSTRNYFFTFFKKHMGMTPAQYRNR